MTDEDKAWEDLSDLLTDKKYMGMRLESAVPKLAFNLRMCLCNLHRRLRELEIEKEKKENG
jgi:hypothetical protein